MEESKEIENLKLLYGDNWTNIYKDIKAKSRLETLYKKTCNITENNNVCS